MTSALNGVSASLCHVVSLSGYDMVGGLSMHWSAAVVHGNGSRCGDAQVVDSRWGCVDLTQFYAEKDSRKNTYLGVVEVVL